MEQCFTLATKFFSHFFTGAVGGASGSLRGRAGANIRRTRALVERENEKFLAHVFPRPQRVAQQVRTRSGSDGVQSRSTAQVGCLRRPTRSLPLPVLTCLNIKPESASARTRRRARRGLCVRRASQSLRR